MTTREQGETHNERINTFEILDGLQISTFQWYIFVLAACSVVLEGFDVQAISFVAPAIIRDWGLAKAEMGPVFGAGLFGVLIGSLGLSAAADLLGRRPILIGSAIVFAVTVLATSAVTNLQELLVLRFASGVGLGGIMPNAMALAGEYSPKRIRITMMMLVSCGFTVGAMFGGLVAVGLITRFGWRSVFIVGGIMPIILATLMIKGMPESIEFLIKHNRIRQANVYLKQIGYRVNLSDERISHARVPRGGNSPVIELFREGRGATTVLFWIVNFLNLLNLFFSRQLASDNIEKCRFVIRRSAFGWDSASSGRRGRDYLDGPSD